MKTRISALMDGGLEAHETTAAVTTLSRDSEQKNLWHLYHVMGDAMRHEPDLTIDVTSRVMAALSLEPTVLSPTRPQRSVIRWQRPVMALAASAAGVAVVAWVALAPVRMPVGSMIVSSQALISQSVPSLAVMTPPPVTRTATPVSSTPSLPSVTSVAEAEQSARLQEYLVAHQTYEGGALVGGASHIRTISASGNNR
ncbi:MAG: hypothetical protein EPO43_09610 [Rugosibacter sp.]|nr:MAG: hypothetical protein EPO43_09610 [Rugosibacter sp.]